MKVNNPVLTGFNPDPCAIRVNDKYYIATSTFEVFPGIQIHESNDLVNWQLICHPLDNMDILDLTGNSASSGVWAPDITYKDGTFYIVFSNMKTWCKGPFKDCYNYVIKSKSIYGPWSKPVYINSSGFDASLFHDDDGKSYFVNMEWDFRQGRGNVCFTGILVQEIDLDTFKLKGEVKNVFKGTDRGFVEGPHIYKKDGYYYLFCAEGGTDYKHAESVSRSRNVFGPYEVHPNKLLITALGKDTYLQRTGHGAIFDDLDGNWYFAHLCGRPVKDNKCILGRETAIQNIIWVDGWPYLSDMTDNPKDYYIVNKEIEKIDYNENVKYDVNSKQFELDFQTLRLPLNEYMIKNKDSVTLIGMESCNSPHIQNTLQRRQQHHNAAFGFKLKYEPTSFQHMAGLMYRYQEGDLYFAYLTYDESKGKVLRLFSENEYQVGYYNDVIIPLSGDVYLKCEVKMDEAQFSYSLDGSSYIDFGPKFDASKISDEAVKCGGFTGAFFAMHACDLQLHEKEATFSDIWYKKC